MLSCGFWCRRGLSICVVAVLLSISGGAQAATAVVKVVEGTARTQPDAAASVLYVFAEGCAVSVSEDVVDAWRRVDLPEGGVGFIRDDQVALQAAPADEAPAEAREPAATADEPPAEEREAQPAAPVTPLAPPPVSAPPSADLQPAASVQARPAVLQRGGTMLVKDLHHLASLVGDDPMVGPMAQHLVHRQFQSKAVGLTGLFVAGALVFGGAVFPTQDCAPAAPELGIAAKCTPAPRTSLMVAGIGVLGVDAVAALLLRPRRAQILKVVNAWNERHPDDPLTIQGSGGFASW